MMDKVLISEAVCTLVFDDPLGLALVCNPTPNVHIEEYERTWAQRDEYGLNHDKVSKQYLV